MSGRTQLHYAAASGRTRLHIMQTRPADIITYAILRTVIALEGNIACDTGITRQQTVELIFCVIFSMKFSPGEKQIASKGGIFCLTIGSGMTRQQTAEHDHNKYT